MYHLKKSFHIEQIDYLVKRLKEYNIKHKGEYMQNIGIPHLERTREKLAIQFDELQQEIIDLKTEHRNVLRRIRLLTDRGDIYNAIDEVLEKEN